MRVDYESPFKTRYTGRQMQYLFSPDNKFITWRKLWVALARAQKELGLPITDAQIAEMEQHVNDINYEVAEQKEAETRHDVLSHAYAFGVQCPNAKYIINIGVSPAYIVDNTDIIIMRDALKLIRRKLVNIVSLLADFADKYKSLPCLAYTHLQPAQLTTVGKRATLWINEFFMDIKGIDFRIDSLEFFGIKGSTGTQEGFLELWDGDHEKVKLAERMIAKEMGFDKIVPVSGQTYSRKVDYAVLSALSAIAQSASKFSYDIRILQGFREIEEPSEQHQISSAEMPYQQIPMRSERITALSRFIMSDLINPSFTAATQFFERTLDDSANKRLSVSEGFLAADAILNLLINICSGLVVHPKIIEKRVKSELPFMATESILMSAVRKGGDRFLLAEKLRKYSKEAAKRIKDEGVDNDLLDRICNDKDFMLDCEDIDKVMQPEKFTGRATQQVVEYLSQYIKPFIEKNKELLGVEVEPEIKV